MSNFERIAEGLDVSPLVAELEAHPELWDERDLRRTAPNSPHREMVDIWLRYRAYGEILLNPTSAIEPHFARWYAAAEVLPACKSMCLDMMALARAEYLGGVLLTKLPPTGKIYGHTDDGWHARTMNYKVYLALKSNEGCISWFEDEHFIMRAGEAWRINNLVTHGVENRGETERISLIISMRVDE